MKIKTLPGYVINRGGERIVADNEGFIETDNQEVIEVLVTLFKVEEILPKKEENENTKKGSKRVGK